MDLNYFYIKQKHRMWVIKLKGYLLELQDMDINQAVLHTDCDLGKWLYSGVFDSHKGMPEMIELEKVHKDMHSMVKLIIQFNKMGKQKEANMSLLQLERVSDHIIALLDKIEVKLAVLV